MDPRHLFMDERLTGSCVYCGSRPDTRDHVPSLVLLDEPLPPDLPVVDACADCNSSFSLDEEYLACFLECVLAGTTNPESLHRDKVKRCLSRNPLLLTRLDKSKHTDGHNTLIWQPEMDRVRRIITKLARGHAAYELYPQIEEPDDVCFAPLLALPERNEFDVFPDRPEVMTLRGWPEIGTRAFYRASGQPPDNIPLVGDWLIVQPGRYRYSVEETGGVLVRMVLCEYLACAVSWE